MSRTAFAEEGNVVKRALMIAVVLAVLLLHDVAPAQPPDGQVALNNDSLRATVYTFRPGAGTGRHVVYVAVRIGAGILERWKATRSDHRHSSRS